MKTRRIREITSIASGIHFVEGPDSNWVVLHDSRSVSLIDTGYPADYELVLESIRSVGMEADQLHTVVVTHGHADHIGNAARLAQDFNPRVLCHPRELPNVRRDEVHQVGFRDVLRHLLLPGVVPWAVGAIRSGGLDPVAVPSAQAFDPRSMLKLSGSRVLALSTPGHTPGHSAFWLEEARVLVTGDSLVTAHPTSRICGPQMLMSMFHADTRQAAVTLSELARTTPVVVLPGHGPLMRVRTSFDEMLAQAARLGSAQLRSGSDFMRETY